MGEHWDLEGRKKTSPWEEYRPGTQSASHLRGQRAATKHKPLIMDMLRDKELLDYLCTLYLIQ